MNKFAVFDIDGTLIRWQLYHAVVDKLAKHGKLSQDAHEEIHRARMRWKNRELGYSFHDYELEPINHFEKVLKSLQTEEFEPAVDQVIGEYKEQTYVFTRQLMESLKNEEYSLIAISGSQQKLVEKIAEFYGFDICLGTKYTTKAGRFTGDKVCPASDKKLALNELIREHQLDMTESYAVGDSKSDASMLEIVEHPIAFNPDSELFEIAKSNQWPIVLERKNMIYRLEYKDGHYVLAEAER